MFVLSILLHTFMFLIPDYGLLLVPKLPLGNGIFEAPASRRTAKQELAR